VSTETSVCDASRAIGGTTRSISSADSTGAFVRHAGFPADVEQVGTLGDQVLSSPKAIGMQPAIRKGVGRGVQDAHHEGCRQVESLPAHLKRSAACTHL